jgi:hypothetical protein
MRRGTDCQWKPGVHAGQQAVPEVQLSLPIEHLRHPACGGLPHEIHSDKCRRGAPRPTVDFSPGGQDGHALSFAAVMPWAQGRVRQRAQAQLSGAYYRKAAAWPLEHGPHSLTTAPPSTLMRGPRGALCGRRPGRDIWSRIRARNTVATGQPIACGSASACTVARSPSRRAWIPSCALPPDVTKVLRAGGLWSAGKQDEGSYLSQIRRHTLPTASPA